MHSKHIALIYAGGTIGMMPSEHGLVPMPDFADVLQALLARHADQLPRCTLHVCAEPIDSSNATPSDWQTIARDIAARYAQYDGFVVLHGTDTMAYTAAALSFMLQGLRKPVVLTGAQLPLVAPDSDAQQNLLASLQCAASDALHEVAICFHRSLLRGNRATKCSTRHLAAFDSPNHPWLAALGTSNPWNTAALLPCPSQECFALPQYRSGEVLSLRFTPGISLRVLEALLALGPRALILECYGAGNVPDRDPRLFSVLERASENGVLLVACSQAPHGGVSPGIYATGTGLYAAGVMGMRDMVFEAIHAKLQHLLALNLPSDDMRRQLALAWCGEMTV